MKILLDMNLSPRLVDLLNETGMNAVHWSCLGAPDTPDSEIMRFAKDNGYIVLTYDLDFSAILASTQDNQPSVIQLRAIDTTPEKIAPFIVRAVKQVQSELMDGAILTIDLNRSRLRLLPLKTPPLA